MNRFTNWAALAFLVLTAGAIRAQNKDLPREFKQLLPRGAIAAIFQPTFVAAKDARISDGEWVLGLVLDGQARAYSLTLLNSHEVVNDKIGQKKFAAVW